MPPRDLAAFPEVEQFQQKAEAQYDIWASTLQRRIDAITRSIHAQILKLSQTAGESGNISADELREQLSGASDELRKLKSECSLVVSTLQSEETQLSQDIFDFENTTLADLFVRRKKAQTAPRPLPSQRLPAELQHIESCIDELGGRSAGWDDSEHTQFTLLMGRYPKLGPVAFANEVVDKFPNRTVDDIAAHWHAAKRLSELNEEKREFLKKWRERKQQDDTNQSQQQGDTESKQKEAVEQRRREKQKARVAAWRAQKNAEKDRQQREQATLEAVRKAEAQERARIWLQRKEEQRKIDSARRLQLEAEAARQEVMAEQARQLERERKLEAFRSTQAAMVQKDMERAAQRYAQINAQRIVENNALDRRSGNVEVVAPVIRAPRDPSRLTAPTTAWALRVAAPRESSEATVGLDSFQPRMRATPSWMK